MTRKVYAILVVTFLALLGLGLHSHQHSKQLCRNNRKSITVRDLRTITEPLSSLETASLCPEVKGSARTTTKEAKTTEVTPAAVDQTVSDATRFEGETRDVRVVVTAAEGVFPAGTEMRVTPASAETTMAAAQQQCDDEQEVVDAVAADITFWHDGREIQPDGNVIVSMYAKRNVEGETHEAVTVRRDGIAEVMGDACGNMGAFTTDHFTVYAIVGKTYGGRNMTKYARQVYNFYLDGILIQTQIVKDGDALSAPPAPGGYSKKEFIGWFKENTDTEFPFGTVSIPSTQTTNDTFRINARFKDLYKVTFYANNSKSIIFQVKSAESGQTVTINDVEMPDSTQTVSVYKIFDGWKGVDGNIAGEDTTIAGTDVEFVPNFVKGNWVFFDSRGGTPVPEQIVKEGGKATEPGDPTYEGHTFLGWEIYNATDSKYEDFDFENTVITNTTTLFAKWQANTSRYKLRIWRENADDEEYTLHDSLYLTGATGEEVPFDDLLNTILPKDKYEGFHLNGTALPTWRNNISNFTNQYDYHAQYTIFDEYGYFFKDSTNAYLFHIDEQGDTIYEFDDHGDTVRTFSYWDAGAYIDDRAAFFMGPDIENNIGHAFVDTTGGNVKRHSSENDGDLTIHGDGSTVVNVFYSRDHYRFLFRFGSSKEVDDDGNITNEVTNCSNNEDNTSMHWSRRTRSNQYGRKIDGDHINTQQYDSLYDDAPYRYTDLYNTAMSVKHGENLYRAINGLNSNRRSSTDQWEVTKAKVSYFVDDRDWAWYAGWKEDPNLLNLWELTPRNQMSEINPGIGNQVLFDGNFLKSADGTPVYPHGSEVQMILRRIDDYNTSAEWQKNQFLHQYNYNYESLPAGVYGEETAVYNDNTPINISPFNRTINGASHRFSRRYGKLVWGTYWYGETAWMNAPQNGFTTVEADQFKTGNPPLRLFPNPEEGATLSSGKLTVTSGEPQLWKFFSKDFEWVTGISLSYLSWPEPPLDGDVKVSPPIRFYNLRNQYPVTFIDGETALVDSLFYYEQYLNLSEGNVPGLAGYPDSLHVVAQNRIKAMDGIIVKDGGKRITRSRNGVSYKFDGWYTDPQFEYPASYPTTMPYHELTYYAKWVPDSVAVTFLFENGEGDTTIMVKYDNACALPDAPVWEGHSFIRWEDANGIAFNENGTMLKDTNVYARWSTFFTYAVRYNAGTAGTFSTETDPCTYLEGAYAATLGTAVPNNPADTVFSGWRIGNSSIILTKSLFAINSTNDEADTKDSVITLNAVYAPVPRPVTQITYHANYPTKSATDTTIAQNYIVNDDYVINQDTTSLGFRMAGYKFFAWSPVASPNVLNSAPAPDRVLYFTGDTIALEAQDNHLYAVWEATINISGTKVWNNDDISNRPENITIRLYADGTELEDSAKTVTGTEWTWTNLPKYKNGGTQIVYTISEDAVAGYTTTITGNPNDGFTVTNTPAPDIVKTVNGEEHIYLGSWTEEFTYNITTTIPVMDGLTSFVIYDTLDENLDFATAITTTVDGESVPHTQLGQVLQLSVPADKLSEKQGKTVSISFNAKFKTGKTHADLVDYENYSVPNKATYKINTNLITKNSDTVYVTPAIISFKGKKTWDDNENRAGQRPTSIAVEIKNGTEVLETIHMPVGGKWEYTSKNYPVFNASGDSILYTVVEQPITGYKAAEYSDPDTNALGDTITVNITNTYVEETVEVTVQKIWSDENNIDGSRPANITINLYADYTEGDDPIQSVTLTGPSWSHTFTGLQKFRDGAVGELIIYTVDEAAVPTGYAKNISGFTITNSYTPARVNIPFRKIWNDNSDQDGKRPETVTFGLFKNDAAAPAQTQEVNAAENIHNGVFANLLKKESGVEVTYSVKELDPVTNTWINSGSFNTHYTASMSMLVDTFVFTNAYTPEVIKVAAIKIWDDDNNIAGQRPNSLTFTLKRDGNDFDPPVTVTVTEADNWKHTWVNLPKYHNKGTAHVYNVVENSISDLGYTAADPVTSTVDDTTRFTFTNSYEPDKTSLTVIKNWDDVDDQDALRPTSLQVQLQRKAPSASTWENVGAAVALTTPWSHTFSELDKYVPGQVGVLYEYRVREVGETGGQYPVAGGRHYDVTYSTDASGNQIIKNSLTPADTTIAVKKVWSDEENRDGKRPASVKVQLYADDTPSGEAVILSQSNNWTHIYTNLPKYNHSTTPINYTIKEHTMTADGTIQLTLADNNTESVAGLYTVTYGSKEGTSMDTLTATNTHNPEKMTVRVNKIWNDESNRAGFQPTSVTVTLKADDDQVGEAVTLNAGNTWKYEWTDLNVFRAGSTGDSIIYSITENSFMNDEQYNTAISNSGLVDGVRNFTVTNTHEVEYVSVSVTKAWSDADNVDNLRPTSAAVQLYRQTTGDPVAVGSIQLLKGPSWSYTWTGLDKVLNGEEVVYLVDETAIPSGYTKAVTGNMTDGFTITNSHTPLLTSVQVTKQWNDENNRYGKRPTSIQVQLYANDVALGSPVTLEGDSWSHTWNNLPLNKEGAVGVPVNYTVAENSVPTGYTYGGIEGNAQHGYVISNNIIPITVKITAKKVWEDTDNQDGVRPNASVQLYADGTAHGAPVQLTEAQEFTHTWEGLEKYKEGEVGVLIVYTVKEVGESSGKLSGLHGAEYTVTYAPNEVGEIDNIYSVAHNDTMVITNSYTPEVVSITANKTWADAGNQDGFRPTTLSYTLKRNSVDVETVNVSETESWSKTWSELPKYQKPRTLINYEVVESDVDHYTSSFATTTTGNSTTYAFTNEHTPETVSLTVYKHWDDNNNDENLREPVTVQLYRTTSATATFDPTASNNPGWTAEGAAKTIGTTDYASATWENLPKYHDKKLIRYAVRETSSIIGYVTTYAQGGEFTAPNYCDTITNRHQAPVTVTLDIQKKLRGREWFTDDQFSFLLVPRENGNPMPVSATTQIGGTSTAVNDSVKSGSFLPITFRMQDLAGATSKTFSYTIRELTPTEAGQPRLPGITYTQKLFRVEITVSEGSNGTLTAVPTYWAVTTQGNEETLDSTVEVPVYINIFNESSTLYHPVAEKSLAHHGTPALQSDEFQFTLRPVGANAAIAPMPANHTGTGANRVLTVSNTDDGEVRFFANDEDGLLFSYTELRDHFNDDELTNGISFEYQMQEVLPASAVNHNDGTVSVTSGGITTYYDAVVHFRQFNIRLTIDGDHHNINLEAVNDPNHKEYFLDANGDTVKLERDAASSIIRHSGDVPLFLNARFADTSLTVTKTWVDYSNSLSLRPDSAVVRLKADGVLTGDTAVLKEGNSWTHTFSNLPSAVFNPDELTLTPITYTVEEAPVENYSTGISGNIANGFIVTNTLDIDPADTSITVLKVWKDPEGTNHPEITVRVLRNNVPYDSKVLNDTEGWSHTFEGLPVYDIYVNGEVVVTNDPLTRFTYTVDEQSVPTGYTVSYSHDQTTGTTTVTNTIKQVLFDIPVTKKWEDASNQDGFRPANVLFTLMGSDGSSRELSIIGSGSNNTWTGVFENLPTYDNDYQIITYTLSEPITPEGYTQSIEGYTVTNSHTPEDTTLAVKKRWDDADNQDGLRPTSVTVKLLANNDSVNFAVLNDANNWQYTFEGLDKYKAGTKINYSIVELNVPENYNTPTYGTILSTSGVDTLTVTNTHTPASMTLVVYKDWNDGNNAAGLREPAKVVLYQTTDATLDFDPDSDNEGWSVVGDTVTIPVCTETTDLSECSVSWEVPVYSAGKVLRYAVKEVSAPADYLTTYEHGGLIIREMDNVETITNTYKLPVDVTLEVAKLITNRAWFDTDTFAMELFAHPKTNPMPETTGNENGTPFSEIRITNADSVINDSVRLGMFPPITFTMSDLKGKSDSVFHYTIRELAPDVTDLNAIAGISYSLQRFEVKIHVTKDDRDSLHASVEYWATHRDEGVDIPDSTVAYPVVINRYDEQSTVERISANKSLAFTGDDNYLKENEFQFKMRPVGQYAAKAPMPASVTTGTGADRVLTVTNTFNEIRFGADEGFLFSYVDLHNLGFTDEQLFEGVDFAYEAWEVIPEDAVNHDNGLMSLKVGNIETYYDAVVHYRQLNVRIKEAHGEVIMLIVTPVENTLFDEYYIKNNGDTVKLMRGTPESDLRHLEKSPLFRNARIVDTAVAVTKIWNDQENENNRRPASVAVTLYADGQPTDNIATLNEDNGWKHTFTGIPFTKLNDQLTLDTIVYTVVEEPVNHYLAPVYSGNAITGFKITNTLDQVYIDIPVTKVWDDRFNNDGFRPDSVTLTIVGTTESDTVTFTRKLGGVVSATESAHNTWDSVFTDLPKYDSDLNAYDYTLSEEEVPYYTTLSVTGDIEEGFTVTNNHRDSMVTFTLKKEWEDNGDQDGIRPAEVTVRVEDESALDDELIILSTDNQFTRTVSRPKFVNREVNEISVQEYQVPNGYTVSYTGSPEDGQVTITNTHVPDSVEIVVSKIWDDHNNNDGIRPASISVNLYANGDSVDTRTITGTGHEWETSFGRWPVKSNGDSIEYSLSEAWVSGYQWPSPVEIVKTTAGVYKMKVTNTHKLDSINLTAVKVWDDDHLFNMRSDVTMVLFRSYNPTATFDPEHLPVNGNSDWAVAGNSFLLDSEIDTVSVTWAHMPKYYQGTEIRYAVKEINCPEHYSTSYTFGGELTESNDYTDTVTNSHAAFEPATLADLAVQKKLLGRQWLGTDIFEMALIPVDADQPMPANVDVIDGLSYAPLFITPDSTFVNDSVRLGTFEPIIFTSDDMAGSTPKTFVYHIRELYGSESDLERIVGMTYGMERYEVDITVAVEGNTLIVSDVAIFPVYESYDDHNMIIETLGDQITGHPMITNIYRDSVTVYHMVADKQLTVVGLNESLQTGDYRFVLKPVGANADKAPMPQGAQGTGSGRTDTVSNEGNAVHFFNDALEDDGLRFDYTELIAAGFNDAQLNEGVEFEYEMHEVIPEGATFNDDSTFTWTLTTVNSQGIMVDEIYDGIVHFRKIHVQMEEIDGMVVLHVTSGADDHLHDYYINGNGDTTLLELSSPLYPKRHGHGGVPIFRNARIARIDVSVEKIWDDWNNALNTRPESITVTLMANGVATDSIAVLNEDNEWAYTFKNLKAAKSTIGLIEYSVQEVSVDNYETTYRGDMAEGYVIVNTLAGYGEETDCTISVERDQLSECPEIDCTPVTDADGYTYAVVKIDGYCWMAENLRTQTPNAMSYQSAVSPDAAQNMATYGYLYTWFDAAGGTNNPEPIDGYVRGVCPNGWHLPTAKEINVLMTNSSDALRSESYWAIPAEGANSTGFNALPAGYYNAAAQRFEGLHSTTLFHGDTPSSLFSLEYYCCKILPDQQTLQNGYSVRCVKDCE